MHVEPAKLKIKSLVDQRSSDCELVISNQSEFDQL